MEWFFMATMLGVGAVLNYEDFVPIIKKPHMVLLGAIAQFAIMPFAGFLIAKGLRLSPELTLGIILVGAVPGAMASNVISYLAKADVAYSISLTALSTFLAPILTPAITYFYAHTIVNVKFWPMFFSIIKMVIIPLLIGFSLKHYFKNTVEQFSHIFPAFSTLFIAIICGLIVALNRDYIMQVSAVIFAAVVIHNFAGLIGGYGAGTLYRFSNKKRRTLSLEVGMQNAGLGAVLALKLFSPRVALVPALFATWCVITASILAEVWSRSAETDTINVSGGDNQN